MAKIRPNEPVAAKRRVAVYVYQDDGVTPAPLATDWLAQKAICPLIGTHAGTVRVVAAGAAGNAFTFKTVNDGAGAGSVTHVGSAYTYHYQTGVTTMTNVSTVLAADGALNLVAGTFTGTDILVSPGDTQGFLAFSGGYDLAWKIRAGGTTYAALAGTFTNTGIDGEWIIEFTQAETNFIASELGIKCERAASPPAVPIGFTTRIVTVEMDNIADFNVIGEGSATYGDMTRAIIAAALQKVSDFRTGTYTFKSQDGAKTRWTVTADASGRITSTVGDLTP